MREIWRDIPSYKGLYQASNYGRIRSVPRKSYNARGQLRQYPGRILKAKARESGRDEYLVVTLCHNGEEKQKKVHRLVLEAFEGPCPPGMEGCHNDGNRYNNKPDNLRWGTRKSNNRDKYKHGTAQQGEGGSKVRLREHDVLRIRYLWSRKIHSMSQLGKMFGVHTSTIKSIIYRKTWRHI